MESLNVDNVNLKKTLCIQAHEPLHTEFQPRLAGTKPHPTKSLYSKISIPFIGGYLSYSSLESKPL